MKLRAITLTVLFWTFDPQRGSAQGDPTYLLLLDSYARGQTTPAVEELSAWPEARVRAAVRTLDPRAALDRARTAMMLHTEAAFEGPADGREPFHVDVARSFLQRLLDEPAEAAAKRTGLSTPQGVRDFGARWQALIVILYCVKDDPRRARLEINRGPDPNHKEVNLVAGAVLERGRGLLQAAQRYRSVLSRHPDFLEARLRLGWVLHLNYSRERGREHLEEVAARATRPELLYLAHLFLGAVHERANRLSEAAREYEAARGVAPLQSSVIALIRIESALGHDDRARALAADIPATSGPGTVDPWHYYNLCFTGSGLLEGLRAEAQRQ